MKKLLLFLVLIFTTLNVHANWVLVSAGEDADFYVKTDSIKRKGYMVTFWEIINFTSVQKNGETEYSSMKVKTEMNCNTEEEKHLFTAVYSGSMGSGNLVDSYKTNKAGFDEIIPDTIAHSVLKFVCSKK
jgi:hypothetical protein